MLLASLVPQEKRDITASLDPKELQDQKETRYVFDVSGSCISSDALPIFVFLFGCRIKMTFRVKTFASRI